MACMRASSRRYLSSQGVRTARAGKTGGLATAPEALFPSVTLTRSGWTRCDTAVPRLTTLGWTAGAVSLIAIVLVGLTGHSGATAAWGSATPSSSGTGSPSFTLGDVAGHATQDSCWAAVDDGVYDLTGWIDRHPGGQARILALCGTDATAAFQDQHDSDDRPQEQLAQFRIGDLLG